MNNKNFSYLREVFIGFFLVMLVGVTFGQQKKPVYANYQVSSLGLLGSISEPDHAIDGNIKNSSTIKVPALHTVTQYLGFSTDGSFGHLRKIPVGTEIMIKFSMPQQVLGLLSGIKIGTFNNLKETSSGKYLSSSNEELFNSVSLLALLKGYGVFEYKFTTTKECQGLYISGFTALSINFSISAFHAYIMENAVFNSCTERNMPIDVLYGARSTGIIDGLIAVSNPYNVLNDNPSEFAKLSTSLGVLTTSFIQTIFPTPSTKPQLVRIVLERPGALLDLALLSNFSIQTYLGNVPVGLPIKASSFLALRLLPGTQKFEVLLKVNDLFDRVEIALDNTVTLLTTLNVYEIRRFPYMELLPEAELAASLTACERVDLKNAIAHISTTDYDYYFFKEEVGGTSIPAIVNLSGKYFIEARDKSTGCAAPRQQVYASVLPLPGKPHLTIMNVKN